MKTLEEHNSEIEEKTGISNKAGVSCPFHRDVEMEFLYGGSVNNIVDPPTQTVICPTCGHIGYKRVSPLRRRPSLYY